MSDPLRLVTVHHEGAGAPTDDASRYAFGGYAYGIGVDGSWKLLRDPHTGWATLNYNRVSVDICLSGDRDIYPVTDADLRALRVVAADARGRGWLVADALIAPHRWMPGSRTVCPGTNAMARWPSIVTALSWGPEPTPPPVVHPTLYAGMSGLAVADLQHRLNVGAQYALVVDGLFGPATKLAVCAFQSYFELVVDGIVGPKTWAVIDYCYAIRGGH